MQIKLVTKNQIILTRNSSLCVFLWEGREGWMEEDRRINKSHDVLSRFRTWNPLLPTMGPVDRSKPLRIGNSVDIWGFIVSRCVHHKWWDAPSCSEFDMLKKERFPCCLPWKGVFFKDELIWRTWHIILCKISWLQSPSKCYVIWNDHRIKALRLLPILGISL